MTMFMVLSSWLGAIARVHPVHLMNADSAPDGCQSSDDKPIYNFGCESAGIGCYHPHPPSPFFDGCISSGLLLKMEVGIRKGAWQRAWRYPAYLWSLRWVYAVKKNLEVGIRRIPTYTPQYTTECAAGCREETTHSLNLASGKPFMYVWMVSSKFE